jgi:hypothetical protein
MLTKNAILGLAGEKKRITAEDFITVACKVPLPAADHLAAFEATYGQICAERSRARRRSFEFFIPLPFTFEPFPISGFGVVIHGTHFQITTWAAIGDRLGHDNVLEGIRRSNDGREAPMPKGACLSLQAQGCTWESALMTAEGTFDVFRGLIAFSLLVGSDEWSSRYEYTCHLPLSRWVVCFEDGQLLDHGYFPTGQEHREIMQLTTSQRERIARNASWLEKAPAVQRQLFSRVSDN